MVSDTANPVPEVDCEEVNSKREDAFVARFETLLKDQLNVFNEKLLEMSDMVEQKLGVVTPSPLNTQCDSTAYIDSDTTTSGEMNDNLSADEVKMLFQYVRSTLREGGQRDPIIMQNPLATSDVSPVQPICNIGSKSASSTQQVSKAQPIHVGSQDYTTSEYLQNGVNHTPYKMNSQIYPVAVTHKRNDQIADSMGVAPEMNTAASMNIQALVQQLGTQHTPVPLQANSTNMSRYKIRPPPYNGQVSWNDFFNHFSLIARKSGWDDDIKCLQLSSCLRGSAQAVVSELPTNPDYNSLVAALKRRFGSEHRVALYKAQLRTRTKSPEESLAEFAHEIRRLCRLAHPNQAIGDLEDSAIEKFMSSISGGLAAMVSASKPKSLEEALIVAIEAETHTNRDKKQSITEGIQEPAYFPQLWKKRHLVAEMTVPLKTSHKVAMEDIAVTQEVDTEEVVEEMEMEMETKVGTGVATMTTSMVTVTTSNITCSAQAVTMASNITCSAQAVTLAIIT